MILIEYILDTPMHPPSFLSLVSFPCCFRVVHGLPRCHNLHASLAQRTPNKDLPSSTTTATA